MRPFTSTFRTFVALAGITALALATAPSASAASWKLDGASSTGLTGVSPHVERTPRGDIVFRSDGPTGTAVALCTDSGCTPLTFNAGGGPVTDFTVLTLPSGAKRGYFVDMNPNTQTKSVSSAPCLDADCLSIGARTPISPEASVPLTMRAWGVPDPVALPDGRVRVYMVESPVEGHCTEKIASYISTDGVTFAKEPGWRLEGGYVDTEVLRAKDGDWVMVLADIGCTSDRNQKLFISESADGLTWSKPQVLTGKDMGKLDPTGYEISPNTFRVYYATGAGSVGQFGPVERATISIGTPSIATTTTLNCKKGKKIKKVTAAKCPPGYKPVR